MSDIGTGIDANEEMVYMRHPDIEGPVAGPVSALAYKNLYEPKGWTLATAEEAQADADAAITGQRAIDATTLADIEAMDEAALEAYAPNLKIDPTKHHKFKGSTATGETDPEALRADLIAAFKEAHPEVAAPEGDVPAPDA